MNFVDEGRRLIAAGADQEMILLFFRDNGADKIDSINSIRILYGISMTEAKELIDHSKTWADRLYGDMEFHETARRALRELAKEHGPLKIEFLEPDDPKTEE